MNFFYPYFHSTSNIKTPTVTRTQKLNNNIQDIIKEEVLEYSQNIKLITKTFAIK